MIKIRITKEDITSVIMALISVTFFCNAGFGMHRNVLFAVLFNIGCGLGFLSLAIQPRILYKHIKRDGNRLRIPRLRGLATIFDLLGILFMVLALVAWIASFFSKV